MKTKIENQKKYCKEKGLPLFVPGDGICFSCHKQIYEKITEEVAATEHITGCPICHRTYCG